VAFVGICEATLCAFFFAGNRVNLRYWDFSTVTAFSLKTLGQEILSQMAMLRHLGYENPVISLRLVRDQTL